jgi:hypothetical protein
MHQAEPDWTKLRACVDKWLDEAYAQVQRAQPRMTEEQTHVAFAASFCLLSCYDYMASAFDAFEKGRFYAGLACCRPVAETAITFLWCVTAGADHRDRFERWMKTTLKEYERFLSGLSNTFAFRRGSRGLSGSLDKTREMLDKLQHRKELPRLRQMLESLDRWLPGELKASDLYPMLYQYLCGSAHAGFMPERYFRVEGDVVERVERLSMPGITPWVALTSAFYMAVSVLMYFRWDYAAIKAEYQEVLKELAGKEGQIPQCEDR